ncbi:hypothetical protein [Streptosporangium oxazolinicum]
MDDTSPITLDEAARLYTEEGWTLRRLAPRAGCAHQTLHTRLRNAGVTMRTLNAPRAKRLPEAKREQIRQELRRQPIATWVARSTGVCAPSVRALAAEDGTALADGRLWSPVDRPLVVAMRGDGMTIHEIARRTGWHWNTIWRTLDRAGLTRRIARRATA